MKPAVSKFFRSLQIYFPYLQDYRFGVQRTLRKILNQTHEEDFEILPYLPHTNNTLYLDIGANRGDAIQSILMRRPESYVVAFEPNAFLVSKLKKLYEKDPRVLVHNCGLGDAESSFDLFIPFYNNYMFDGLASFRKENASDWLKGRLYGYDDHKLEVKKMQCAVRRLDDFSLRPCFIKIDVQGFEYEVLAGARRTLNECRPVLLLESPGNKEGQLLQQCNYEPFVFKNRKLLPGMNNYNVFFVPKEQASELLENVQMMNVKAVA